MKIQRILERQHRVLLINNAKYVINKLAFRDWNGWSWRISVFRGNYLVHEWQGKKRRTAKKTDNPNDTI